MLGGVDAAAPEELPEDLNAAADASPVRCLDSRRRGGDDRRDRRREATRATRSAACSR
jgi:hypothetical protein